ncbi:MAG: NYN domain-containing protein [Elusimicrobiota bacterium]|jgi:predicted RNA-binding protein with PIN domain
MSLHYLVDGYNVLYAMPELPPGDGQAKREALLRYLAKTKPQGSNAMTVVFDSHEGLGDRQQATGMEVVFTAGESADDWLANKVRAVRNPRIYVVVSNDKGIRTMIRGTGAKWLSAEEFLQRTPINRTPEQPESQGSRDDITDEFRKKWL